MSTCELHENNTIYTTIQTTTKIKPRYIKILANIKIPVLYNIIVYTINDWQPLIQICAIQYLY